MTLRTKLTEDQVIKYLNGNFCGECKYYGRNSNVRDCNDYFFCCHKKNFNLKNNTDKIVPIKSTNELNNKNNCKWFVQVDECNRNKRHWCAGAL